jgi:hypothetical protein
LANKNLFFHVKPSLGVAIPFFLVVFLPKTKKKWVKLLRKKVSPILVNSRIIVTNNQRNDTFLVFVLRRRLGTITTIFYVLNPTQVPL